MIAGGFAVFALGLASPAAAQLGASVSLHSDYRYRSYSLTQDRPAAALNLSYDHAGLYAGGSLVAVNTADDGWRPMGYLAYAGYARPLSGPTLDVGVATLKVKYYEFPDLSVRNNEVYVALVGTNASVRIAYAPDYFEQDYKTLYLDLGASYRPKPDWRVFGHAGLLNRIGGSARRGGRSERYDLSAGVARRIGPAEITVQATKTGPGAPRGPDKEGLVVSASWFF